MPANIREKLIGFGKAYQTDIATANTVANIWRLNKLNTTFTNPRLNTENEAAEFGKGHEFATEGRRLPGANPSCRGLASRGSEASGRLSRSCFVCSLPVRLSPYCRHRKP